MILASGDCSKEHGVRVKINFTAKRYLTFRMAATLNPQPLLAVPEEGHGGRTASPGNGGFLYVGFEGYCRV